MRLDKLQCKLDAGLVVEPGVGAKSDSEVADEEAEVQRFYRERFGGDDLVSRKSLIYFKLDESLY